MHESHESKVEYQLGSKHETRKIYNIRGVRSYHDECEYVNHKDC
jgi:hypothetical protein